RRARRFSSATSVSSPATVARGTVTTARRCPSRTRSPSDTSRTDTTPVEGDSTLARPLAGTSWPATVDRRVYVPSERNSASSAATLAAASVSTHSRVGCASEIPPSQPARLASSASLRNNSPDIPGTPLCLNKPWSVTRDDRKPRDGGSESESLTSDSTPSDLRGNCCVTSVKLDKLRQFC